MSASPRSTRTSARPRTSRNCSASSARSRRRASRPRRPAPMTDPKAFSSEAGPASHRENAPEQKQAVDRAFMRQALAYGARGLGTTATNPSVGATLYVTLEPCSHRSVRGGIPCVEHTILSGVKRVVSAMADPNPFIAGLGHALLRTAGIEVTVGVLEEEARQAHRGYLKRITQGRPMVTFKVARTADGYAGGAGGVPLAVSSPVAGGWVHLQRAHHDVIMLGISSVLSDDPQLTVRLPGMIRRSPIR